MKKAVSFLTSLLMVSSLAVPFVYAEDDTAAEEKVSVSEEADKAEADDSSEKTSEPAESEKEEPSEKEEKDFTVWHLNATDPAEGELFNDEENREYIFKVINPGGEKRGGTDKWDLQFRIRGFSIVKDHEYSIRYTISSSNLGSYYTKIANYDSKDVGAAVAGEVWHNQYGVSTVKSYVDGTLWENAETTYSDAWNNQSISKGDTLNVSCNFTGIADIPEAEWCFFLGGAGSTTANDCFSAGTELRFRNLVLTDNTTGETLVSAYPFTEINVKGDISGDGKVDTTDLTLMSLGLLGDADLDDSQIDHADLDGDGIFHLADAAHLMRFLAKKIDEL
ncbi:dockerin type I repeat-containing protein [Ruminococcus sp. HUN007]|uniref:dockerin type I repeat-containing protein n=1 Tax=Ruminococcus sp. HUN007 TaxID=1514668 RepID=UPI0005D23112|nr:dockerin type I repeat-containing protein [Ruminococcus sp. HUN007]